MNNDRDAGKSPVRLGGHPLYQGGYRYGSLDKGRRNPGGPGWERDLLTKNKKNVWFSDYKNLEMDGKLEFLS